MSARPTAAERLENPDALLSRTDLRELGLERRAVDAVFRAFPVVVFEGYSRPLVTVRDYLELVERARTAATACAHSSVGPFYARRVQLAGVPVRDGDVRELERLLRDGGFVDVASKLDHALTMETRVLALTVVDRESMLRALDEPPTDALAELRGVLLSEHEWRVRERLVGPGPDAGGLN